MRSPMIEIFWIQHQSSDFMNLMYIIAQAHRDKTNYANLVNIDFGNTQKKRTNLISHDLNDH